MRSRTVVLGLVASLAGLLTGACGGSDGGSGGGGAVSGDLRVVHNWTGPEGEAFQAVIDGFEAKHPDVKVEVQQVPFDQTQSLLTQQFVQGGGPDVAVGLPGIVRSFASQDLLMNLDDDWDKWVDDGEYPQSIRDIASAGTDHAYSVFFKGNVNGLVWYTPAELKKLGLDVPSTWSDFTAAMDTGKAKGVAPVAVGGKDAWPLTQWADPIILGTAGPEKFNQLARGEIGWDDPAIVAAFTKYSEVAEKYFPKDALGTGFIDATCARAKNKALFQNQGAFVSLIAPAECDKSLRPGKDFSFFKMPQPDASQPPAQAVSGDLFFGNANSDNEPATKALLTYLGSAQAQEIWAKRGGYIAPNSTVPMSVYPTSIDRAAAKLWPRGADAAAGYDLDDWIGGEIQSKYTQGLQQLIRDQDVDAFIETMTQVDTRSK